MGPVQGGAEQRGGAVQPADPWAGPVRQAGSRSRAGNAMGRTRAALLVAAAAAVEARGVRRLTMSDVATSAGVAKGTLYNHFRTKDEMLAALAWDRVDRLAVGCATLAAADGLPAALAHAAEAIADDPVLRRVAGEEPAVLQPLVCPAPSARDRVGAAIGRVLEAAGATCGDAPAELVRRWLASYVLDAGEAAERAALAAAVAGAVDAAGRTGQPLTVGAGEGQPDPHAPGRRA